MLITISLDEADPPSGSVGLAGGPQRRFVGWLGLLRVLGELVRPGRR